MMKLRFALLLIALLRTSGVQAQDTLVAVATNVLEPVREIEARFEAETGYEIALTSGASGLLYAQIRQGAPFDVFLSADQLRPAELENAGLGQARFSYARGALVLYARDERLLGQTIEETLRAGNWRRIAIANPDLAPYGRAASEALDHYGVETGDRLVTGANAAQAFSFIMLGAADLALIPVGFTRQADEGGYWPIPYSAHQPIYQDAILLNRARENPAALAFYDYLASEEARSIFVGYGYQPGD